MSHYNKVDFTRFALEPAEYEIHVGYNDQASQPRTGSAQIPLTVPAIAVRIERKACPLRGVARLKLQDYGVAMQRAIGISVHTGWGACVVVGGTIRQPEIVGNEVIKLLGDEERFCFHRAAEMKAAAAEEWLARVRAKALAQARGSLATLMAQHVQVCAIVAKDGILGNMEAALATHMRIHSAEGFFFRDVFRDACPVPCRIIPAASLDITAIGKLAAKPWGRDQKLAALAAWRVMSH